MVKDKRQSTSTRKLNRFWIIGAGRFGKLAVERIAGKKADAAITIIDKRSVVIDQDGVTQIRQEGIQWLAAMLASDSRVDIIVPAIPIHVAVEWIKRKLQKIYNIEPFSIPDDWLSRLPHPMRGKGGQVYVSHADFRCPDNCPEPETICTHTGKPRSLDLFRLLAGVEFGNALPIVLRSHQILPGVGGIYPGELFDALEMVRQNRRRPLMIATACRCHGVIDFIQVEARSVAAT